MSCVPSAATVAVLALLQAGVSGTYDQLAAQAGLPPSEVSVALRNLRRYGHISVMDSVQPGTTGRPRVIYTLKPADDVQAFDALAFLRQHWRN